MPDSLDHRHHTRQIYDATDLGRSLLRAASDAAALALLGGTTVGIALFQAPSKAAARDVLGLGYYATGTDASYLTGTLADARLSSNVALRNADNVFSAAQTIAGSAPSSEPGNGKAAVGAGIVVAANAGDVQLRLGNGADLDTYGFDIGRQGATSDATIGFLRFKGRQIGYSGYTFHTYGGEALRIDNSGTSTFYGTAPSSVSSGKVAIGGGDAVASGRIGVGAFPGNYAINVEKNGTTAPYPILRLKDTSANGHAWWLYSRTDGGFGLYDETAGQYRWICDASGVFTLSGSAPSSVSAGQVAIGGGVIRSAGKIITTTTADGAITTAGKITAKAAVPASFADLAAVRTYLASILT